MQIRTTAHSPTAAVVTLGSTTIMAEVRRESDLRGQWSGQIRFVVSRDSNCNRRKRIVAFTLRRRLLGCNPQRSCCTHYQTH